MKGMKRGGSMKSFGGVSDTRLGPKPGPKGADTKPSKTSWQGVTDSRLGSRLPKIPGGGKK